MALALALASAFAAWAVFMNGAMSPDEVLYQSQLDPAEPCSAKHLVYGHARVALMFRPDISMLLR
jgi:hypothetical protein